jgi:hypothetical protein
MSKPSSKRSKDATRHALTASTKAAASEKVEIKIQRERLLDEALEQTFPASDPLSSMCAASVKGRP